MIGITVIGIDPGIKTGLAVANSNKGFSEVVTLSIFAAQDRASEIVAVQHVENVLIAIEDCRLRTWVDPSIGKETLRGVGSVERDCSVWQEFCERNGYAYVLVAPKSIATKMDKWDFSEVNEYPYDTSNHGRDAAMLARKYYNMLRTGQFVMPAAKPPLIKPYPTNRKLPKRPEKKPKAETTAKTKKVGLGSYMPRGRRRKW